MAIDFAFGHHLLTKHVLAGIQTSYRDVTMGPQWSRNEHGFEIFLLEHLAPVVIFIWFRPARVDQSARGRLPALRVYVTQRAQIYKLLLDLLQVSAAHVAGSDQRQPHGTAFDWTAGEGRRSQCGNRGNACERFEKVAPPTIFHFIG